MNHSGWVEVRALQQCRTGATRAEAAILCCFPSQLETGCRQSLHSPLVQNATQNIVSLAAEKRLAAYSDPCMSLLTCLR